MPPFYGVQWPQSYRANTTRQFTFYHQVPKHSWDSFDWPWKVERLSWPWSHPVVLNMGPLDWESSNLTTRQLLYCFSLAYLNICIESWTSWKDSCISKNFPPPYLLTDIAILLMGSLPQSQPIKASWVPVQYSMEKQNQLVVCSCFVWWAQQH